jgi:hypothetical protein
MKSYWWKRGRPGVEASGKPDEVDAVDAYVEKQLGS